MSGHNRSHPAQIGEGGDATTIQASSTSIDELKADNIVTSGIEPSHGDLSRREFRRELCDTEADKTPGSEMLKWMTPGPKWRRRKRRRGRRKRLFLPFAFINDAFRRSRHPVAALSVLLALCIWKHPALWPVAWRMDGAEKNLQVPSIPSRRL
jgi:hypothetical protein